MNPSANYINNKSQEESFLESCTFFEMSLAEYLKAEGDKIHELIARNEDTSVLMEMDKYIKFNLNLFKNFQLSIVKRFERGK